MVTSMKKRGILTITRPTARGSRIAQSVRTDNTEAHARMYTPLGKHYY